MSAISNAADFLRLLRENPDFRDEARRLLLTQELIELPERFARFEAYVERRFNEIQGDIAALKDSSAAMQHDIDTMQANISALQADGAAMRHDINTMQASIDTMQGDINTMQASIEAMQGDINAIQADISALQADGAAMRHDINAMQTDISALQADSAAMRHDINAMQTDISALQADSAAMRYDITVIQEILTGVLGDLGRLKGAEYERTVSRGFVSYASMAFRQRHNRPLRRNRLLNGGVKSMDSEFEDLISDAVENELISEDEKLEIERADAVMRGQDDGATVYFVGEFSTTVNNTDIDRAIARAAILSKATGSYAWPMVIGETIPHPQRTRSETEQVAFREVEQ